MDKTNIIKLAKILDKFIELESSFVLVEDIKAIKQHTSGGIGDEGPQKFDGVDIITPYGVFYDSADFESLKMRIGDVQEALKEKKMNRETVEAATRPLKAGPELQTTQEIKPALIQNREVTIVLLGNGSSGNLYDDPNLKVVNRSAIQVLAPDGSQVASGTEGGTIMGELISGIVYESGRYTFAAKEYPADKVTVKFQVRER